ncbi:MULTISPECIES: HAD family hydrolase [unclassified Meiothermus]|uniref:HAD family hydrolase n=1 Tax=unclassified Meiothermus TaxID=370471 RepID=UPI000D7CFBCE|nr:MULTISPECIES: HAD-IA family hydrolase [unclassified Meiothermus]PZA08365.1 HAD family hydrolase [Meiothermus sp. Pnk-1]RYM36570.1 HAD family hydrolase [Meiothermus sp. PNK-Is4]
MRAVFFDMDDTLLEPRHPSPLLGFKRKWGLPLDRLVIEGVRHYPAAERQAILEEFQAMELALSQSALLRAGVEELLAALREGKVYTALITNNHRESTATVLAKHRLRFDLVLTREDGPPKPAPDLLLKALEHFALDRRQAIFVGDSWADQQAAQQAGIRAFFLATPTNADLSPRFGSPNELLLALKEAKLL